MSLKDKNFTEKQNIGKKGEELALKYLLERDFEKLATNFKAQRGEIDIIVRKDKVIHFVEVKTRKNNDFGNPESFLSQNQISKISQTAQLFLEQYEQQTQEEYKGFVQYDIISILFEKQSVKEILHLEDAF